MYIYIYLMRRLGEQRRSMAGDGGVLDVQPAGEMERE
jgi:hypothetical protein